MENAPIINKLGREIIENYKQLKIELNSNNFKTNDFIKKLLDRNNKLVKELEEELIIILNLKPIQFKLTDIYEDDNMLYFVLKEYFDDTVLEWVDIPPFEGRMLNLYPAYKDIKDRCSILNNIKVFLHDVKNSGTIISLDLEIC